MPARDLRTALLAMTSTLALAGCSTTGGAAATGPSQAEIEECQRRYKGAVAATEDTRSDSPDRIVSNNEAPPTSSMRLGRSNNPCIPNGQQGTQVVSQTDASELAKDRARLLLQQGKVKDAKVALVLGFQRDTRIDPSLLPLTRQLQTQLQPQLIESRRQMVEQTDASQGGCFFYPEAPEGSAAMVSMPAPVVIFEQSGDVFIKCALPRPMELKPEHTVTLNIERRLGDNNYKTVLSQRTRKLIKREGQVDVVSIDWQVPALPKAQHAYFRAYLSIEDGTSEAIHTSDSGFFWFK